MKIIQLEAQNVKKLKAVEIHPNGNLVVIGGKNGAGKTSVLDSIAYALAGKSALPSQPVRKGQKKATVICELDDLTVKRTMTATGGGTLTVENKEGAVYKSPQAILDALVGKLTFDPLEFSVMGAKEQVETLKGLVGLDFNELNTERQRLYDERTIVNTEGKSLKIHFEEKPEYPEAPEDEVSISGLMEELQKREDVNQSHAAQRMALESEITHLHVVERQISGINEQITGLQEKIDNLKDSRKNVELELKKDKKSIQDRTAEVEVLEDMNLQEVKDQIANAETVNKQVRANVEREILADKLVAKRSESAELSDLIIQIDDSKALQLAEAQFPVPGLSFSASEVLYNDIPFNQASSAEKLRVSVAMGLAMNPKLKVLLIRDGSLLDEDNLKLIAEMAEENEAQVWLERVGKGAEVSVIIEDGEVEKL